MSDICRECSEVRTDEGCGCDIRPNSIKIEPDVEGNDDDSDRATIHANGIVVDVIANLDGSVYIETYAYQSTRDGLKWQAVVQQANINRYEHRHPNIRVDLATSGQVRQMSQEVTCATCGDQVDVPGDEDPEDTLCVACAEEEQGQ